MPCKPLTVLFNSSIFESSLLSLSKIRSSFFVTPSVRFRAAITWSSSSEFFESGEYECLNFFPSGDDSSELLDVARISRFSFWGYIDTRNFHRRPNKSTMSGTLRNTSYISNSLPSLKKNGLLSFWWEFRLKEFLDKTGRDWSRDAVMNNF